jgi:hypothetical protein
MTKFPIPMTIYLDVSKLGVNYEEVIEPSNYSKIFLCNAIKTISPALT